MASYASATYKNTSDLERGAATRSPLHKSMEFSAIDNVNLDGLGIVYTKQPPSYASSTSPKPTSAPRWRDNSKRPHYAHHRRISTAAIIALAQKQSLTPQKVIAIFSIVASATYLARALPPLWPSEPSSVYNPRVVYHPAEIYEAMRPVEPKRSKKTRASQQKQKKPQAVVGQSNAQSVQEAKAQANTGDFFDQVEPKYWKEMSKQNGLDSKVLQKGQEVDYALVDDLASEDVEALILDEEEDAFYDASAFSSEESEIWEDAVHLDPNAKAIEKNSLPLPLRGSHRAPNAQKDQSIAGLAYLANGRKEAAKVIKREKKAEVLTKTQVVLPQHTAKSTIFEDEGQVMGDILMKKRK